MDYTKLNTNRYATQAKTYDEGLRAYMIGVYKNMSMALGLTGLVAFFTASSPSLMALLFQTPLSWVVMFAPLAMVMFMSARVNNMSVEGAQISFWVYAGLMGLSLSTIFIAFTSESIARVFFITASLYGVMSIYGYTTKRDLTGMYSFLMMGLIGLMIASLVNIFLGSTMIQFVVSAVGVLVFTGLTAYDTQRVKQTYYAVAGSPEVAAKASIFGALSLYLDFINLFIFLLQFVGDRRQ